MIPPILFSNIPKTLPFRGIQQNSHICDNCAPDVFTPSVSVEDKNTQFETDLKKLNGIHCARCKQKMLSKEKYENLKHRMSQVQNGHELYDIIEEHKDYLTNSTSLILKDLNYTNNKYPNADIKTVINKIHNHAPLYYFKALKTNTELLELAADKLGMSENDKKHYKKTAKELKFLLDNKSFEYGQFKTIMNNTLKETDYSKKRKLFEKVMRQQGRAYKYYKSINSQNLISKEPDKALENLCWALFGRSRAKISSISQNKKYSDINKILVCTDCEHKTSRQKSFFKLSDEDYDLKSSFTQYLHDVGNAINKGELHADKNYIDKLMKHVTYNSGNKINFNKNDINFIQYKKNIKEMPFDNQEGIPCPKCSGVMMTYEQNTKARQYVQESDNVKDLTPIIIENKKYFPKLTRTLAEKFLDITIRDPYISDTMLRKKMQGYAAQLTKKEFHKFMNIVNHKIKKSSLDDNDKKRLQELKLYLRKADERIFYDMSDLSKYMLDLGLLDKNDKFGLRAPFEDISVRIEILQAPVFQSKEISPQNSWSKKFADRLLRNAIMTKDHMIARNNGGQDDLDNTMALHKECNRLKGKKPFDVWFNEDPKTEDYTLEYLNKIEELSSQGKVKNCDNYPNDISNKIFTLTGNVSFKKDSRK